MSNHTLGKQLTYNCHSIRTEDEPSKQIGTIRIGTGVELHFRDFSQCYSDSPNVTDQNIGSIYSWMASKKALTKNVTAKRILSNMLVHHTLSNDEGSVYHPGSVTFAPEFDRIRELRSTDRYGLDEIIDYKPSANSDESLPTLRTIQMASNDLNPDYLSSVVAGLVTKKISIAATIARYKESIFDYDFARGNLYTLNTRRKLCFGSYSEESDEYGSPICEEYKNQYIPRVFGTLKIVCTNPNLPEIDIDVYLSVRDIPIQMRKIKTSKNSFEYIYPEYLLGTMAQNIEAIAGMFADITSTSEEMDIPFQTDFLNDNFEVYSGIVEKDSKHSNVYLRGKDVARKTYATYSFPSNLTTVNCVGQHWNQDTDKSFFDDTIYADY